MPKFFFHLTHSGEIRDEAGTEFATLQEAKCHAVKLIADTLCEDPHKFWESESYRVTIADDAGLYLLLVEMISYPAPALLPTALKA